jgi:pimeloyl-ACP methyl ester carboxylesterase
MVQRTSGKKFVHLLGFQFPARKNLLGAKFRLIQARNSTLIFYTRIYCEGKSPESPPLLNLMLVAANVNNEPRAQDAAPCLEWLYAFGSRHRGLGCPTNENLLGHRNARGRMETISPSGVPKGAVLLIHSWSGLADSFRTYGSVLSDAGYLVGRADLFDGKTAETEADANALRAAPRRIPIYKALGTDIASLRAEAGRNRTRLSVVGFSMGGHWAVWLSQRPEYNVAASAI